MILDKFKLSFVRNIHQFVINSKTTYSMWRVEDNRLATFTRICAKISSEQSYLNKAKILQNFLCKGSDGKEFQGDTLLWVRMLIPGDSQRVYNLQNKQMVKLFARLFNCSAREMHLALEQEGDVSEILRNFFEISTKVKPQESSVLYLQEVEEFLQKLEQRTKEDEQLELLGQLCKQTTSTDLKTIIRIIKQDLRINAKASHVLAAFGPTAYAFFQATRDLSEVVKQFSFKNKKDGKIAAFAYAKPLKEKGKIANVHVMIPLSPMLANACISVEKAFKKSPTGLFSEIKYDGERVQIHKHGNDFKFFSRNLKPVMDHKVKRFKEFIPKAFPGSGDMILDSEVILVDTVTGELLPFGSLGAHKKKEYPNAEVCLFVFDCILFQGKNLTNMPFKDRRKILEDNITSIKSYVQLSESHFLKTDKELSLMTAKVLKANLEGVVLKDPLGTYQPGKRGWLKVKKDYLFGGRMADTADLVVLGASYGSGKIGGIFSIFLMGCYDRRDHLWKTVTKVHTGLDDKTRLEMHNYLVKLMERSDGKHVPTWFLCNKSLIPDFIAKDPKLMPVWEITGAEFTKSGEHTASGISIRFPRITRLRDDKTTMQATDLEYLENMFHSSKNNLNIDLLINGCNNGDGCDTKDTVEIKSTINLQNTPTKTIETQYTVSSGSSSKKIKFETPNSSSRKRQLDKGNNSQIELQKNKKLKTEPFENNKKSLKKQLTLDAVFENKKSNKQESNLFQNMLAYFEKLNTPKDITEKFTANGGIIATNSKKADIIFYATDNVKIDLDDCRMKYRRFSHHLKTEWILDCLKYKKMLDYGLYAIVLK